MLEAFTEHYGWAWLLIGFLLGLFLRLMILIFDD